MRGVIRALAAVRSRLPLTPRREAAPLALLLLALSSVFAFGGDRSVFYRLSHHDYTSGHTLTLIVNLSAEDRFLLYGRKKLDADGERTYAGTYNRFPIAPYLLAGLAIQPFGDDIRGQILAARAVMLAFFAAAVALAYLALARLIGDRWIALAATLLAFSSYYVLYYHDMIAVEGAPSLFGVMLAFHGMARFAQGGRFRWLLAATAAAILTGWHVAGLIAPFVLIGLASEAWRAGGGGVRRTAGVLAGSRYLAYGAFAALCCALILGFNLGNEYRALGGEVPLTELPSFRSLLRRTGADAVNLAYFGVDWLTFLRSQFGGAGGLAIPFAAVDRLGLDLSQPHYRPWPPPSSAWWFAALGAGVSAVCLAGLRRLPCRAPFAALLLAGWCWAIPFRGQTALHEFEAIAHIGAPLVFWTFALTGLRRLPGGERARRAPPALAAAALAVFVLSAWDMRDVGHDAEAAGRQRELLEDRDAVRALAEGRSVVAHLSDEAFYRGRIPRNLYLAGSFLQIEPIGSERQWRTLPAYEFALLPADFGGSLTPDNRRLHLYRLDALPAAWASIAAREPDLRAAFDLRLGGGALTWARDPCGGGLDRTPFYLEAVPADAGDLPADRAAAGFETFSFLLSERGVRFDGKCMARLELPDYPIAGVRTGQRAEGLPPVWEASLPVEDASFPRGATSWRETAAAATPVLSSAFEVSLEGRTLHYVRDGCADADAEARFFVHLVAADGAERRTFAFAERGLRWGGACLASFELPDYPILGVRTGQYGDGGEVWAGQFPLDPGAWRARYEAASAAEPALRSAFDVRAEGRTLHYTREQCAEANIAARFFLHVTPLDAADLPEERRESGFANLDFAFGDRGLRYGGRCLASVPLPDYPIARVATGQFEGDARLWEGEIAFGE